MLLWRAQHEQQQKAQEAKAEERKEINMQSYFDIAECWAARDKRIANLEDRINGLEAQHRPRGPEQMYQCTEDAKGTCNAISCTIRGPHGHSWGPHAACGYHPGAHCLPVEDTPAPTSEKHTCSDCPLCNQPFKDPEGHTYGVCTNINSRTELDRGECRARTKWREAELLSILAECKRDQREEREERIRKDERKKILDEQIIKMCHHIMKECGPGPTIDGKVTRRDIRETCKRCEAEARLNECDQIMAAIKEHHDKVPAAQKETVEDVAHIVRGMAAVAADKVNNVCPGRDPYCDSCQFALACTSPHMKMSTDPVKKEPSKRAKVLKEAPLRACYAEVSNYCINVKCTHRDPHKKNKDCENECGVNNQCEDVRANR